ncbi:MAG: ribosome biogenesis GTPase YlqF [Clostridia bacterium]|nr:ribosome biogenesis GTPase YlqF [Clostridia bacterium]
MNIQWFPGHMKKTERQIEENIRLVDIVYELVDARIPLSSKNPDIERMIQQKPRIILLNKSDLADKNATDKWISYYKSEHTAVIPICSQSGDGLKNIQKITEQMLADKIARQKQKGMVGKGIKALVVGVPNVGKSSFINKICGRSSAKTGDRPGVTKGKQWITVNPSLQLLDTPGILWPKFEDNNIAYSLAFTGAIRDEIIDVEELGVKLCGLLRNFYPDSLRVRYKLEDLSEDDYELLHQIGRKRGCVVSGGEIDTRKAAILLLDEFRGGKLGRITLELPATQR